MIESIIGGLVSGLIVTIFVVVFRLAWLRILVPWFEELVYKDAKFEGKWFSLYTASTDMRQETITLQRHGHAVSGTIICSHGPDEGQSYSLLGSFRNMILPLIYETTDRTRTDRGTITLRSVRDGQRLEGIVAYYDTFKDSIDQIPVIWFRSKDELDKTCEKIKTRRQELKELAIKQEEARRKVAEITGTQTKNDPTGNAATVKTPPEPQKTLPEVPQAPGKPEEKTGCQHPPA